MRGIGFQILFTVILFVLISKLSVLEYNAFIYGIFLVLLGVFLIKKTIELYKVKKGLVSKGQITNYSKSKNSNFLCAEIKFNIPTDKKDYFIKAHLPSLPKKEFVIIIYNKRKPEKSKIYHKTNYVTILFLAITFLLFLYKFLYNTN